MSGQLPVSVVVPVWNPGPNLDRCVESLLAQSMPADEYEIVLVDDGSTDGTAERLDELAAAHPHLVHVLHIPNSGWPGKPRNVGIDAARGTYVHLVDNDDTLPPYALRTMYETAVANDADVILGRPASDFRGLNHTIYRRTVTRTTLAELPELTETLTPHKMFRRSLLVDHAIRFPEGPVPLEDQMFVLRAYLHAQSIALLSDRPYYFYLRRIGSGRNAGDRPIDPVQHCQALEQVLDVVDELVPDPALRDRLFRRFYRLGLLARLSERSFTDYDDAERHALVDEIRRVVTSRFGPGVHAGCGVAHRVQGHLLLDNDVPGLLHVAGRYQQVGLRVHASDPRWIDGALQLQLDGAVHVGDDPLRCEPTDGGWVLPADIATGVPVADRLLDPARDEPDAERSLPSRADAVWCGVTDGLVLDVADDGRLRVHGEVRVDPRTALVGQPLSDGVWDLRVRLRFGGWNRSAAVRIDTADAQSMHAHLTESGTAVVPFVAASWGALAIDVGEWLAPLAVRLAPTSRPSVAGRRLHIAFDLDTNAHEPLPAQLDLQPLDGTSGGLISCDTQLVGAALDLRLPRLAADGKWQPWLRFASSTEPAQLPFRLCRDGRAVRIEPKA